MKNWSKLHYSIEILSPVFAKITLLFFKFWNGEKTASNTPDFCQQRSRTILFWVLIWKIFRLRLCICFVGNQRTVLSSLSIRKLVLRVLIHVCWQKTVYFSQCDHIINMLLFDTCSHWIKFWCFFIKFRYLKVLFFILISNYERGY